MDTETKFDRPNTVAGLVAKHRELTALREKYKAEIKKLTVDIDHLDAAIRLFDPNADTYAIKEYVTKHRAEKGSVKRFVLNTMRETTEPLTSRQISEMWLADRGLVADEATTTTIRKRIGACIKTCVGQGLVEECGVTVDHDQYGPYKLWRLKRGDAPAHENGEAEASPDTGQSSPSDQSSQPSLHGA